MTELAAADSKLSLCLSHIDGFESVIARMPTLEECRDNGLPADAPVLVVQRRGQEQLYPAEAIRLTIDTSPPPAPSAARDAARYVVEHILEDLDNVRAKVADLCHAAGLPSSEIVRLADQYRQERTADTGQQRGKNASYRK